MNNHVYAVVYGAFKNGKVFYSESILEMFSNEKSAKNYANGLLVDWLKNQQTFDPEHKISGNVVIGESEEDDRYAYIDHKDADNYAYYDIYEYDLKE